MTVERSLMMSAGGVTQYTIANSLRFRSSASAYLNRTPASAGNRRTWTYSCWTKICVSNEYTWLLIGGLTSSSSDSYIVIADSANGYALQFFDRPNGPTSLISTQTFRDPSAWYHIVVAYDSTQATASNRIKMYVNGVQITSFSTATYPALNTQTNINNAVSQRIATRDDGNTGSFYLTEVNFIDGQALTPSSFGQTNVTTGVWEPKQYSGSYGTNGFKLNFSNGTSTTTLGYDSSGNSNNWTTNNISLTSGATYDWMIDSPTSYSGTSYGVGNYAVLNPLSKTVGSLLDGNLTASGGTGSFGAAYSTIYVSSGKWYWEGAFSVVDPNDGSGFGVASPDGQSCWIRNQTGSSFIQSSVTGVPSQNPFGVGYSSGDVIGVAFDVDNLTLSFYKNGTLIGSAITGFPSGRTWAFFIYCRASFSTTTGSINFGQRPFAYTPPSGYKSLCTQNLPAGTVTTSGTFTGNASADGPFVWLNGVPTAMTINGNAVTFGTHADKTAGGFKVRTSSSSYNTSGSNTYSITSNGGVFKNQIAQPNP